MILHWIRQRRWRARLARYPQVERDHVEGLQQAMREATLDMFARLQPPPTGRWFVGGYRLADLLGNKDALAQADWAFSSHDKAEAARCREAVAHGEALTGGFVEKLASCAPNTFQGVLLLWPSFPPLRALLQMAAQRLVAGGRLAVLTLRDGTPEPSERAMTKALRSAIRSSVRSSSLGHPASREALRTWMGEAGLGDAVCWTTGRNLVFDAGTDARLCFEQVSGGAAFPEGITGQELANTRAAFDASIEEECRGAGRVVLTYEFVGGLAVKGG